MQCFEPVKYPDIAIDELCNATKEELLNVVQRVHKELFELTGSYNVACVILAQHEKTIDTLADAVKRNCRIFKTDEE